MDPAVSKMIVSHTNLKGFEKTYASHVCDRACIPTTDVLVKLGLERRLHRLDLARAPVADILVERTIFEHCIH